MNTKIFWTVKDSDVDRGTIRPKACLEQDDSVGEEIVRVFAEKKDMVAVRVQITEMV